jgi:geranyl-CoA carboxylase alpha subunit
VEYLVADGAFHFLEMNTRLQVEHPVTEAIFGIDLVDWQIRIAQGAALPPAPPAPQGHAMEARLCAEDGNFLPQTGRVALWQPPGDVRVDHAMEQGLEIGGAYDSMLAKIIVHAPNRESARARLRRALEDVVLEGVVHNAAPLGAMLALPAFITGQMDTGTLDTLPPAAPRPPAPEVLALAAFLFAARRTSPDDPRFGWTNGPALALPFILEVDGQRHALNLRLRRGAAGFTLATPEGEMHLHPQGTGAWRMGFKGQERVYRFAFDGAALLVCGHAITDVTQAPPPTRAEAGGGQILAPMAGRLAALLVAEGDAVGPGQPVALLEAMKMQHPLVATRAGRVLRILAPQGAQLSARQVVAEIGDEE